MAWARGPRRPPRRSARCWRTWPTRCARATVAGRKCSCGVLRMRGVDVGGVRIAIAWAPLGVQPASE
eukprot:8376651-Pyramimonas_sp.AAC.1